MKEPKLIITDRRVFVTDTRGRTFTHKPGSVRIYRADGSIKKIVSAAHMRALKKKAEGKP